VNTSPLLPGTRAHQALLRSIVDAYAADERVLAVGVLGSLGRGTWDEWSDLDLDVVVADDVVLDAVMEAHALFERLCQSEALVVPGRPGEVDVLLPSLEQFSIRYHTIGTTNAHIIDDLKIVGGHLDRAAVLAAGVVHSLPLRTPELIASEALRFAVSVDTALRRGNVWQALRGLDELRWRLQELFAITLRQPRPAHAVDALAGRDLKGKLGGLLAQADLASIAQALANALDLIVDDELTSGHFAPTHPQCTVLAALRRRTRTLDSASLELTARLVLDFTK
jgi:predicted nucleotidyltransferase